jgi:hypothetical protein
MAKNATQRKKLSSMSYDELVNCPRPENMWQVFQPDGLRPPEFFATANVMAILIMLLFASLLVGGFVMALWAINEGQEEALAAAPGYALTIHIVVWAAKGASAAVAGLHLKHFWTSIPRVVAEVREQARDIGY